VAPWFAPTLASPDYFNACAGPPQMVYVPTNFAGFQPALSGQGYAGAMYIFDGNDAANSYAIYQVPCRPRHSRSVVVSPNRFIPPGPRAEIARILVALTTMPARFASG